MGHGRDDTDARGEPRGLDRVRAARARSSRMRFESVCESDDRSLDEGCGASAVHVAPPQVR